MTISTINIFERTVQKSNEWLDDISKELKWDDNQQSYKALKSVLHVLRDRLPPEVAVKFSAQMPMLIRGLYFEGWNLANTMIKVGKEDFLVLCADQFEGEVSTDDMEHIVKAVFRVIRYHLSDGEISHIKSNLPVSIVTLWEA